MPPEAQTKIVHSIRDLDHCSPKLCDFYRYWDGKRGARSMPSRGDIDPMEMRDFLNMLMLVDVVGDNRRYVYRLVGTKEVEGRGKDPTGLPVSEASYGLAEDALAFYDLVVANRMPVVYAGEYAPRPGRITKEQVLGLPLSNDGQNVNMIVVFSVTEWQKDVSQGR
jgi:hypothetical protein